jgi:acyl-coenzyme A thioesterase PaaI-like protein
VKVNTHLGISPKWVGEALNVAAGRSSARLRTIAEMAADGQGLVHGGFTFGLADFAAMLAVNDPHVVLGAAEARFLAPVRVGEVLLARAEVLEEKGKKRTVTCSVSNGDIEVFAATFTCFVLDRHILEQ